MSGGDDWKPGDLALCVTSRPCQCCGCPAETVSGRVYTVESLYLFREYGVILVLEGVGAAEGHLRGSAAYRFRKIRPHTPDEEDRATIRLLNGAPVREPAQ